MTRLLYFLERNRSRLIRISLYLALIPFLRPRGFDEVWGWYKTFFTLWLLGAMILILCGAVQDLYRNGLAYKPCLYATAVYYILFVLVTLIQQGGIGDGIQKMFAAPLLYVLCILCLRTDPKRFLVAVANILTVIFLLNTTVLNPIITNRLINIYHYNFLGHVQVGAQYALIGCLVGYLLFKMAPRLKRRCLLLVGLSLVQIVLCKTAAGLLVLCILAGGMVLRAIPRLRGLVTLNPVFYYLCYVVINALMLLFSFTGLDYLFESLFSFSGRTVVWRECIKLILDHPLLGYGAYGATIVVPWSHGMNYAHNEFVQRLLDGGIVLCVSYLVKMYFFVQEVQKVKNKKILSILNICMTAMLVVMLFESVTDYFFVIVFFTVLAYAPEISEYRKSRWEGEMP